MRIRPGCVGGGGEFGVRFRLLNFGLCLSLFIVVCFCLFLLRARGSAHCYSQKIEHDQQSDGTIGGFFVPVDEMRKRYNALPEGGLEREIFHASKPLWIWEKMDSEGRIRIDRIKEYCELRLLHYYQFDGRSRNRLGIIFRKRSIFTIDC